MLRFQKLNNKLVNNGNGYVFGVNLYRNRYNDWTLDFIAGKNVYVTRWVKKNK